MSVPTDPNLHIVSQKASKSPGRLARLASWDAWGPNRTDLDIFEAGRWAVEHLGLWRFDLKTGQFSASPGLEACLGIPVGSLGGSILRAIRLIDPRDRRTVTQAFRALQVGGELDIEFRLRATQGEVRWFKVQGMVVPGEPASLFPALGNVGFGYATGMLEDVTMRRRLQASLSQSETRLAEAQSLAHIASWEADADGGLWLSPQMREIFGLDSVETAPTVHDALQLVHSDDLEEFLCILRRALREEVAVSVEYRVLRPDGEIRYISGNAKPWRDHDGVLRLLGTARDVTDHIHSAQALRDTEAQFQAAVEASFDAIVLLRSVMVEEVVIDFEVIQINRNAERLYDLKKESVIGKRFAQVFPGSEVREALPRYLQVARSNEPIDLEYSVECPNGDPPEETVGDGVLWVHEQIVPIPGGVAVTRADISSRKQAHQRIRESELFSQRVTAATPDWVFIYDLQQKQTTYVNRDPLPELGYSQIEGDGLDNGGLFRLVHPDDASVLDVIHDGLLEDDQVKEMDYRVLSREGDYRWVSTRCVIFQRDREGRPIQVLGTSRDVTPQKFAEERMQAQMKSLNAAQRELSRRQLELESLNQRLATLATRDGLTGLHNHRSLQDRLTEEIARAERTRRTVALVMVDVDSFKAYNDRYGHPAGDEVLKEMAGVLTVSARATDFVARYGGEEFAVLLPESRAEDAVRLAERIRDKLSKASFGGEKLTASFGCAEYIPGEMTKADLIREADQALYRAKHDGKDRVIVAERSKGRSDRSEGIES